MEISTLSKNALKIRSKYATLIVDPSSEMAKTPSDGVLLLKSKHALLSKVEGQRLLVEGPGEFEIKGVKISAFDSNEHIAYDIRIDGLEIFVAKAEALQKTSEKVKDYHIVVVRADSNLNQSVITALSPQVVVLYGEKAKEEAKSLGKEVTQTVSKYQTTLEKLPVEMEVVVLG